jgi:hypothetical protein
MKNINDDKEIAANFLEQMNNLRNLISQVSRLENRITKTIVKLNKFSVDLEALGDISTPSPRYNTETYCSSNIISFPGTYLQKTSGFPVLKPLIAKPGMPVPPETRDYRPVLQRDGLILLAWDMRTTENGELYSAYWVTSTGIPRYYASKPLQKQDFPYARPAHKSYAAEDGIEFYGQESPAFIVHVAPELMMSNPRHAELRSVHISLLKHLGSNVDFNYKYLLKTEKKRNLPSGKEHPSHQAGA